MTRRVVESDQILATGLPFSPAVWAGDLLFVSGQASTTDTGSYVEDSFAGEFGRSVGHLRRILQEAGLGLEDVVQVTAYLGAEAYREQFNVLYRDVFKRPYPARTTIQCGIAMLKFELDAVAYRPA